MEEEEWEITLEPGSPQIMDDYCEPTPPRTECSHQRDLDRIQATIAAWNAVDPTFEGPQHAKSTFEAQWWQEPIEPCTLPHCPFQVERDIAAQAIIEFAMASRQMYESLLDVHQPLENNNNNHRVVIDLTEDDEEEEPIHYPMDDNHLPILNHHHAVEIIQAVIIARQPYNTRRFAGKTITPPKPCLYC